MQEIPIEDAPAVSLFFALDTQWRRHAMTGERLGIDYSAIRPTAELHDIALSPRMMSDLQTMEAAALAQFAERDRHRTR